MRTEKWEVIQFSRGSTEHKFWAAFDTRRAGLLAAALINELHTGPGALAAIVIPPQLDVQPTIPTPSDAPCCDKCDQLVC